MVRSVPDICLDAENIPRSTGRGRRRRRRGHQRRGHRRGHLGDVVVVVLVGDGRAHPLARVTVRRKWGNLARAFGLDLHTNSSPPKIGVF